MRSMSVKPIRAFVHLEKAGGTSVIAMLRSNWMRAHVDVIPRRQDDMLYRTADLAHLLRINPGVLSIAGHSVRPAVPLAVERPIAYYTLLREPKARYLSDYYFHVEHLGFDLSFDCWVSREDRHNFQTRALAGVPDVDAAKRVLTRMSLVGVVERFEEFAAGMVALFHPHRFDPSYKVRNSRSERRALATLPTGRIRDQAVESVNQLDLELYRYARDELIPQQAGRLAGLEVEPRRKRFRPVRGALNRVYRNAIYKPHVGRHPLKPHKLPLYVPQHHRVNR